MKFENEANNNGSSKQSPKIQQSVSDKMKTMAVQKGILGKLRKLKQEVGDDPEKAQNLIQEKIKEK